MTAAREREPELFDLRPPELTSLLGVRWYVPCHPKKPWPAIMTIPGEAGQGALRGYLAFTTWEKAEAAKQRWCPEARLCLVKDATKFNGTAAARGVLVLVDLVEEDDGFFFHRFDALSPGGDA